MQQPQRLASRQPSGYASRQRQAPTLRHQNAPVMRQQIPVSQHQQAPTPQRQQVFTAQRQQVSTPRLRRVSTPQRPRAHPVRQQSSPNTPTTPKTSNARNEDTTSCHRPSPSKLTTPCSAFGQDGAMATTASSPHVGHASRPSQGELSLRTTTKAELTPTNQGPPAKAHGTNLPQTVARAVPDPGAGLQNAQRRNRTQEARNAAKDRDRRTKFNTPKAQALAKAHGENKARWQQKQPHDGLMF
jgi:hypothetical protein